jgi:hypothetical protein
MQISEYICGLGLSHWMDATLLTLSEKVIFHGERCGACLDFHSEWTYFILHEGDCVIWDEHLERTGEWTFSDTLYTKEVVLRRVLWDVCLC